MPRPPRSPSGWLSSPPKDEFLYLTGRLRLRLCRGNRRGRRRWALVRRYRSAATRTASRQAKKHGWTIPRPSKSTRTWNPSVMTPSSRGRFLKNFLILRPQKSRNEWARLLGPKGPRVVFPLHPRPVTASAARRRRSPSPRELGGPLLPFHPRSFSCDPSVLARQLRFGSPFLCPQSLCSGRPNSIGQVAKE